MFLSHLQVYGLQMLKLIGCVQFFRFSGEWGLPFFLRQDPSLRLLYPHLKGWAFAGASSVFTLETKKSTSRSLIMPKMDQAKSFVHKGVMTVIITGRFFIAQFGFVETERGGTGKP